MYLIFCVFKSPQSVDEAVAIVLMFDEVMCDLCSSSDDASWSTGCRGWRNADPRP